MAQDPRVERLLDTVELVRSRGDPERGRLCMMSLVAFLAGEEHGDRPRTASPLIAAFARPINDAMDRGTRQRLIPFAPRVIGTAADGDHLRGEIMHLALMQTLLPAVIRDLQVNARGQSQAREAEDTARLVGELRDTPLEAQPRLVQDARWDRAALIGPIRVAVAAHRNGHGEQQAEAVARILIAAVSGLARPSRRSWYWDLAVGLLDRLCEVERAPAPAPETARSGNRPVAV